MKISTIAFIAALVGLATAAAVLFFMNGTVAEAPSLNSDVPPAGRPSTSAPAFAISACQDKVSGDTCVMEFGGDSITGRCFKSGDVLACGPTTPTDPVNQTETADVSGQE